MADSSLKTVGLSFRGVQIMALDSTGFPVVDATTEYAGVRITGAKALTLNRPEWETTHGTGDDRVLASFVLPPQQSAAGELRVGAMDLTAEAILGDISIKNVDERQILPFGTDIVELPQVCVLAWREAKSVAAGDEGRAHYEFNIIPRATLTPLGGAYDERAIGTRTMGVVCHKTSAYPWGETLVFGTDGHTEMEGAEGTSEYVPRLCSFVGDGAEVEFLFDTDHPAVSTDKISVYVDGTIVTSGTTVAVTGVTWDVAPADAAKIVIFYEVAS